MAISAYSLKTTQPIILTYEEGDGVGPLGVHEGTSDLLVAHQGQEHGHEVRREGRLDDPQYLRAPDKKNNNYIVKMNGTWKV